MEFEILATYAELANEEDLKDFKGKLPAGFNLLKHQVDTYNIFTDEKFKDIKVIFNKSMTGAGKSIAGLLPLIDNNYLIASYPTNELISDQFKSFKNYDIFKPFVKENEYEQLFGMKLTIEMIGTIIQRVDSIKKKLENKKVIFTNTDMAHLMASGNYGYSHNKEQIPITITNRIDYFVFDEFHIFETPQVTTIVNDIIYTLSRNPDKKFIFLSATPKPYFTNMLKILDIKYIEIDSNYSSTYIEGENKKILHPISIDIKYSNDILIYIKGNLDLIKNEIIKNKQLGFKSAIIVDSIIKSKSIYKIISSEIGDSIKIVENNGLSSDADKGVFRSLNYDLVIGTSTIDIGIDFDINLLIFEASSKESFLQRLGRLGRVKSHNIESNNLYKAFCIIPERNYKLLEKMDIKNNVLSRLEFNNIIQKIFKDKNDMNAYIDDWGSLQLYHMIKQINNDESIISNAINYFNKLYGNFEDEKLRKKHYAISKNKKEIIDNLTSFRGLSNFQCAILDTDNTIKTYDLLFILKNTNSDFYENKEEFIEDHQNHFKNNIENELKIKYCNFFARVKDYKDESEYFSFKNTDNLTKGCLDVNSGFALDNIKSSNSNLININRELKKINLVYFIACNINSITQLRERLSLPFNFKLFVFENNSVIAFNQEALILDAIAPYNIRRPKDQCFIV